MTYLARPGENLLNIPPHSAPLLYSTYHSHNNITIYEVVNVVVVTPGPEVL